MDRVLIRQVRLEGFGLYGEPTSFRFTDGLNVFVAPNESGKSTLLAGLQSVLFGLPEKSDPEQWGTARFRHWLGAPRFTGMVLLQSPSGWHRIERDFGSHDVRWSTAPLTGSPADDAGETRRADESDPRLQATPPPEDKWKPLFHDQHNPSGRSEAIQRYQALLRNLIHVDDPGLFRLTYCLAQDPEERTPEEAAFRSRQVPEGVQSLISGSGGQVDRVLTLLFDRYAAITQATADAELIRPGKTRAVNQRTPGRLEEVRERKRRAQAELAIAGQVLEDLQGSQERLEELREALQQRRESLKHDRRLHQSLSEWLRARRERSRQHQRVVELERAIRELEELERAIETDETLLAKEYAEYRSPGFAFEEKRRELQELSEADRERVAQKIALEEAQRKRAALEQEVGDADAQIAEQYSAFDRQPHLLRDFDAWQEAAVELEHIQAELLELDGEIAALRAVADRYQPWTALDPSGGDAETARPAVHLREMRTQVPRLLAQVEEAAAVREERDRLSQRLREALAAPAAATEEVLAEAEAFHDRHALYRTEAENRARRLGDIDERLGEVERAQMSLHLLEEALTSRLGPPDQGEGEAPEPILPPEPEDADDALEEPSPRHDAPTSPIPPRWEAWAEQIQQQIAASREEAQLLRRIDAAERTLRSGLFRIVALPALGALVLAAAAGFGVSSLLTASMTWRLTVGINAGIVAAIVAGIVGYRRGKGTTLTELTGARGRLARVRRTLSELERSLGDLARLDVEALQELRSQILSYGQRVAEVTRAQALAPAPEDRAEAAEAADEAQRELTSFQERMAPFGNDPARLVAEWRRAQARLSELGPRLAELETAVGPVDPSELSLDALPEAWQQPLALATLVRGRLDAASDGSPAAPRREPGGEVTPALETAVTPASANETSSELSADEALAILKRITDEHWKRWSSEAAEFEAAVRRLSSLQVRRQALLGGESDEDERLQQLRRRVTELSEACAPLSLETPREEIEQLAQGYEQIRRKRDRSRTLLEEIKSELPRLEQQAKAAEQRALALRDGLRGLLRPAASDPDQAIGRLEKARATSAELQRARRTREQVLATREAQDVGQLRAQLEAAREESRAALERVRELQDRYVMLQELSDADPGRLQQQQTDLERRIAETEQEHQTLAEQQETLRGRAADAQAEGRRVGNVAALELELREIEAEEARLVQERDAVAVAFRGVREAEGRFSRTHRERLEERATALLRTLSLTPDRSIQIGDHFEIGLTAGGGLPCAIRQLSQGARDQLALALRLAVADLLSGDTMLPMFFDDPFLSFDPERLAAIRETLDRIASERQVVLLSHRPELAAWGHELLPETPGPVRETLP